MPGPARGYSVSPSDSMMDLRTLVFGGSSLDSRAADALRAVLQFGAGVALAVNHGIGKIPPSGGFVERVAGMGFPLPDFFAWLCVFAEVGCALLLAVGLATRAASAIVFLNMVVVLFLAQAGRPFGDREDALLFMLLALFFAVAGAGRYSFDEYFRRRSQLTTAA